MREEGVEGPLAAWPAPARLSPPESGAAPRERRGCRSPRSAVSPSKGETEPFASPLAAWFRDRMEFEDTSWRLEKSLSARLGLLRMLRT